jgi:hypothetical protein
VSEVDCCVSGNDGDESELIGILYIRDKFLVLLRLDCLEVAIHTAWRLLFILA